jgi:NDP-sugar pyrophosphorylase family protein
MVRQIIIAAGGVGSRISHSLNPYKSKSLMEYEGKPLIYYLISSAKEAGINEFFISVNENNRTRIEKIADSLEISFKTKLTGDCFAKVPYLFRESLDYKFLLSCGHDPLPSEHIKALIDKSNDFDAVTTSYSNKENSTANKRRVRVHNIGEPSQRFELIDLNKDVVPEDHIYARNPYIINLDIIDEVAKNNFIRTAGYYIYKLWESGGKVTTVKAISPVEFDYDHEFQRTKKFLDNYLA